MTATKAVVKKDSIGKFVTQMQASISRALPSHETIQRYARCLETSLRRSPKLQEILNSNPASVGEAVITLAQLGIPIGLKNQGALVPFGKECVAMIGYEGLIDMAYRSKKVLWINADVVHKEDKFDYQTGSHPFLNHKMALENRGKPIAVYAVAHLTDTTVPVFTILTPEEIEKVKRSSKASGKADSPWNTWTDEMWKKTAIRRLCKLLPKSVELRDALTIDREAEEKIISVEAEVVEEDPLAAGKHQIKRGRPKKKVEEEASPAEKEQEKPKDFVADGEERFPIDEPF